MNRKVLITEFENRCEEIMKEEFNRSRFMKPEVVLLTADNNIKTFKFSTNVMASAESKNWLSSFIRQLSMDPKNLAIGFLSEINIRGEDDEKVGDAVMIVISSNLGENLTIFNVDFENRIILDKYVDHISGMSGRFAGFFNWNHN